MLRCRVLDAPGPPAVSRLQRSGTRPTYRVRSDRNAKIAVHFSSMDWKSTAVISGAGILATWFFSMPPAHAPASAVARAVRTPRAVSSTIDIERQAARLQTRPRPEAHYTEPSRNPFRFSQRREPTRPTTGVVAAPPIAVAPLLPPPPVVTLDGIAADTVSGQQQRTAILHTDAGVVLAKEGDEVAGYRVEKIAADAVELVKTADGSTLRLGLR